MDRPQTLIAQLGLQAHPERGFFSETYRSEQMIESSAHGGKRAASTAVYFLITDEQGSTYLHRLLSDEIFHLYEGGPLEVLMLFPDGQGQVKRLGTNLEADERPQIVIPSGTWFGTALPENVPYCLFGCTVSPGFEFADFALAQGPELAAAYPAFADLIMRMSRVP